MSPLSLPGALVISLDFELHWGMRDRVPSEHPLAAELVESRRIVSRLASFFSERDLHATWATVGFLFASSRGELERFRPQVRPRYVRAELDPYAEAVGEDEDSDPIHMAGSLVRALAATPGQEVASHTFSHYYCLEAGQDESALRADLGSAQAIASAMGLQLHSLVLPRNQWNSRYAAAVRESGFDCYRSPQRSWAHRPRRDGEAGLPTRLGRLADTYAGWKPPPTTGWSDMLDEAGLCEVPASAFLRPYSPGRKRLEPLRFARLVAGMRHAARRSRVFHLWWHPHNFARYPEESFALLSRLADEFDRLAESEGMRSLSMGEVAELCAPHA